MFLDQLKLSFYICWKILLKLIKHLFSCYPFCENIKNEIYNENKMIKVFS